MAGDVECSAELQEDHIVGVEHTQRHHQTQGCTAVSQLVQHSTKLGSLLELPGIVTVKCVQEGTQKVEDCGQLVTASHEEQGQDGEEDSKIPNDVGHKKKDVFSHFC